MDVCMFICICICLCMYLCRWVCLCIYLIRNLQSSNFGDILIKKSQLKLKQLHFSYVLGPAPLSRSCIYPCLWVYVCVFVSFSFNIHPKFVEYSFWDSLFSGIILFFATVAVIVVASLISQPIPLEELAGLTWRTLYDKPRPKDEIRSDSPGTQYFFLIKDYQFCVFVFCKCISLWTCLSIYRWKSL